MTSVLVVGAGLAGLTAAFRLREAGLDVSVVEAASAPGGRMADCRVGEIAFNSGARLIYPFGRALHALIREMGLADALVPLRDLSATARLGGLDYRLSLMPGPSMLRTPGLTAADRIRLFAFATRLALLRLRTDPDDLVSSGSDGETLADYADRALGRRARTLLLEALFRGTRSWDLDEIAPGFLLSTLPHMLGRRTVFTLRGGMGQLTRALAARLDVRCAHPVTRVEQDSSNVCRVSFADGTAQSVEIVVVATEGTRARALIATPEPETARFLGAVRYNSLGVVHYALRDDVAPLMRFVDAGEGSTVATFQQLPASPGAGRHRAQLYCQLTPEATRAARRDGHVGALERFVRDDVRRLFPALDAQATEHVEQWIEHKLPLPYPGYGAALARFRRWQETRGRRIYLAGDYLAQPLLGGACASGERAARTILRQWGLRHWGDSRRAAA